MNQQVDASTVVEPSKELEKITFYSNQYITWDVYFENNKIVLEALLDEGWKLYSSTNTNYMGPMPTLLSFYPDDNFQTIDSVKETNIYNPESKDLKYFENKAIFTQEIEVYSGEEFALNGSITYMICDANSCQPPMELPFSINIKL